MAHCPVCGSETEPGAQFCGECGARLEEQEASAPSPSEVSARPQPKPGSDSGWLLVVIIAIVASLSIVLIALYDALGNGGEWADSVFGGGDGVGPAVSASPAPSETGDVTPSPGGTASPAPTESSASPIYLTPEEAIGAFLEEMGITYAGDCADADIEADVGAYCTSIWEDTVDSKIYRTGLTFSEYDTWLLVSRLGARDDWMVVDFAEIGEGELVPPWP